MQGIAVTPNSAMMVYLPTQLSGAFVTTLVSGNAAKSTDVKVPGPNDFNWSEARQSGGVTDTRTITAGGTITAVADAPDAMAANASGQEVRSIALPGLGGALADTDGSDTLSFRLSGLPSGGRLSAGTRNADGTWTLTPQQLETVSFLAPSHRAGTYTLTLTAVATEGRDDASPSSRSTIVDRKRRDRRRA